MLFLNGLSKFVKRSRREKFLFVEAYILLGIFRFLIVTLSFKRIVWLLNLSEGEGRSALEAKTPLFLSELSWAIQSAAARTLWESVCLGQALTGMVMLRLRRIPATLYLGVAKDITAQDLMTAHAWLRAGDYIITGARGLERYTVISRYCCLSSISM